MVPNRSTRALLVCAALPAVACAGAARGAPNSEPEIVLPVDLDTSLRLIAPGLETGARSLTEQAAHQSDTPAYPTIITFETGFRPSLTQPAYLSALSGTSDPRPFLLVDAKAAPDPFAISFSRETSLVDGGFGNAPSTDDAGASYFESPGERFDRYNLGLEWVPTGAENQVQWLVLGGIHAVRADIRRLDDARLSITQASGMVAIPTIGTGVRWRPTDYLEFSTTAKTQSIDRNAGVVDVTLSAQLQLSRLVDLTAGYEYYQSDIAVENLRTSLDREGVFAKLTIRF